MKILFVLIALMSALFLSGCAEQPLISDEEYNAMRGPAPYSPDFSSVLPQPNARSSQSSGHY
jgi:outer membrane lipoprotein-sorting protein